VPGLGNNDNLLQFLLNSNRELTEYDWAGILSTRLMTSEKLALEEELAQFKLLYDLSLGHAGDTLYTFMKNSLMNGTTAAWMLPFESAKSCSNHWAFAQTPPTEHLNRATLEMEKAGLSDAWHKRMELENLRQQIFQRSERVLLELEREMLEACFYSDPHGVGSAAYALLLEFSDFQPDPSVWEMGEGQLRMKREHVSVPKANPTFIFPNPCSEYTAIRHQALAYFDATFEIRNSTGELVMQGSISKGDDTYIFDTSRLPKGLFLIEVNIESQKTIMLQQKFLKQ
jgi:hypothetical protein